MLDFYVKTSLVILVALLGTIILTAISLLVRGPIPSAGFTGMNWETFKNNLGSHYSVTEGTKLCKWCIKL
jgi:hypothetical protein